MKLNTFRITALSLMLGTSAFLYAQDHPGETQPPQDKPQPEAAKPPQDEGRPPRHEDVKPPEHPQDVKPPQGEQRPPKHEESKQKEQAEQHPAQRSADRKHGHIPDDKFRANFGRQHTVVINHPTIVEGQPRFQYGGYTFVIVDVWPVDWAYTDDGYIDYIDGEYFLFDLRHPGVRVAIDVVL